MFSWRGGTLPTNLSRYPLNQRSADPRHRCSHLQPAYRSRKALRTLDSRQFDWSWISSWVCYHPSSSTSPALSEHTAKQSAQPSATPKTPDTWYSADCERTQFLKRWPLDCETSLTARRDRNYWLDYVPSSCVWFSWDVTCWIRTWWCLRCRGSTPYAFYNKIKMADRQGQDSSIVIYSGIYMMAVRKWGLSDH